MLSVLDEEPAEPEDPVLQILKEEVNAEADIEGDQEDSKNDVNDTTETNETDVLKDADKDVTDTEAAKAALSKPVANDTSENSKHDEKQQQKEEDEEKDALSKPVADTTSEDSKHDEKQQQEEEDEEKDEEPKRQPDRGEIRSRILKEQYEKFIQMAGGGSAKQKIEGEASDAESSNVADSVPLSAEDMAKLPKFLQVVAKERAIRLKRSRNDD